MRKAAHELTLDVAVDLIYFGACCSTCKETRRVDLHKLLRELGPETIVESIQPRLRCSKCGARRVVVVTLWKDASTTEQLVERWK